MAKVVPTVYHATLTGAAADTTALVDGVKWDAGHTVGGLTNLDDTSDADKPVSTATQTALDLKANKASPTFTGTAAFEKIAVGAGASNGVPVDGAFVVNMSSGTVPPFTYYAEGLEVFSAQFVAADGLANIVAASSYGGSLAGFGSVKARGTIAAPTAVQATDVIGTHSFRGYGATGFSRAVGQFMMVANQNFTDTAQGTRAEIHTVPDGAAGGTGQVRVAGFYGGIGAIISLTSSSIQPFAPDSLLTVNANTGVTLAFPSTQTMHVVGADGVTGTNIGIDSFGGANRIEARRANGTRASKTALASADVIFSFNGYGYETVTPGYSSVARVQMQFLASEAWTNTAQGTQVNVNTTPNGSTTQALAHRTQASGGFSVGTTTDGGIGSVLANTSIKSQGATAGIGYATGAGGAVTQITSRSTGVTVNTVSGAITLVSAAGVAASWTSFTVTNSAVAATDVIVVNQKSGTDEYQLHVTAVGAGSFRIAFRTTGGVTVEQPVINFAVVKAVAS